MCKRKIETLYIYYAIFFAKRYFINGWMTIEKG